MFLTLTEGRKFMKTGKNSFRVNWAQELGIAMGELWQEHPGHPAQLKRKKVLLKKSEDYWARKKLEKLLDDRGIDVGDLWKA